MMFQIHLSDFIELARVWNINQPNSMNKILVEEEGTNCIFYLTLPQYPVIFFTVIELEDKESMTEANLNLNHVIQVRRFNPDDKPIAQLGQVMLNFLQTNKETEQVNVVHK